MLNYVLGDILKSDETIIAHGCNCQGAFGSGVAGAIRAKYPECYQVYMDMYEEGMELGDVSIYIDETDELLIANCATQEFFGSDGALYADYAAIEKSIDDVLTYIEEYNNLAEEKEIASLGVPMIGCGLGGADFSIVEKILRDLSDDHDIDINIYILEESIYRGIVEKYQPVQL